MDRGESNWPPPQEQLPSKIPTLLGLKLKSLCKRCFENNQGKNLSINYKVKTI